MSLTTNGVIAAAGGAVTAVASATANAAMPARRRAVTAMRSRESAASTARRSASSARMRPRLPPMRAIVVDSVQGRRKGNGTWLEQSGEVIEERQRHQHGQ